MRRFSLFSNLAIAAALACMASSCTAVPQHTATKSEVNVKDFGAVGNGTTDDTAAFIKAIAAAKVARLPMRVPLGTYNITHTLTVDGQEVIGSTSGAWTADGEALPSLLNNVKDGPCIQMKSSSSLHGLDITYKGPHDANFKYAAVLIVGNGIFISNMRIRGAYDGIACDGISNTGRLNIENVFMPSIQHEGVRITGTYDVPELSNVEVWNAGYDKDPFNTGVGFHMGRNDGLKMTDCFAFAMHTAYLFEKTGQNKDTQGTTEASMNGCCSDYCPTGVEINGENWVSIAGCFFWCHQTAIIVNGKAAKVQVTGTLMKANGAPCIEVLAADSMVITGNHMFRPMKEHPAPCIMLSGGTTIVSGNSIDTYGDGVDIAAGVDGANVSGNTIVARGGQAVVIAPGANGAQSGNLLVTKPDTNE